MFFPHIMYGLPMNLIIKDRDSGLKNINEPTPHLYFKEAALFIQEEDGSKQVIKAELQLFTTEYIKTIEVALQYEIDRQAFLRPDFKLLQISTDSGVPAHHLTYFFNDIKQVSFTDWRNELRIAHAIKLMGKGHAQIFTMQNISLKCGFVSQNTFNRAFKIVTSFTPTEYLKNKIS
ncbi:MAG: AraC family transcriptional regulator, partial [Bacteroidota bacterium]